MFAAAYVILYIAGQVLHGRDDPRAGRVLDLSFGVMLIAALYTAILVVISIVSEPGLMSDLVTITLIVVLFFAVLLLALLGIFDLGVGAVSRARRRARN